MARTIAVANQKGGVGKTTTVVSLGAGLAELGARVLLVDMDPQGALSLALGVRLAEMRATMYDVLREEKTPITDILLPTPIGCDLAPSNINLAGAELELVSEPGREFVLKSKLSPVTARYDYVLIDCPPSLGLLTLNALTAASEVLIPVQSQYLALRGMELLLATIAKVKDRLNPGLGVLGMLPTFFDGRTRHAREVVEELRRLYGEMVVGITVPTTIKFADTSTAAESILSFSSSSPGAQAYRQLAKEVRDGEKAERGSAVGPR
ncbi:MAG TPA: ParA family protein [Dehalococcoidia bacterium]|jgi:chromosome partitioning protein|nr:ParA family protein [Dehalococcoidia bacterium]